MHNYKKGVIREEGHFSFIFFYSLQAPLSNRSNIRSDRYISSSMKLQKSVRPTMCGNTMTVSQLQKINIKPGYKPPSLQVWYLNYLHVDSILKNAYNNELPRNKAAHLLTNVQLCFAFTLTLKISPLFQQAGGEASLQT